VIEVRKKITEDYGNGKEYYAFQGKKLAEIPDNIEEKPSLQYLRWHNEKRQYCRSMVKFL